MHILCSKEITLPSCPVIYPALARTHPTTQLKVLPKCPQVNVQLVFCFLRLVRSTSKTFVPEIRLSPPYRKPCGKSPLFSPLLRGPIQIIARNFSCRFLHLHFLSFLFILSPWFHTTEFTLAISPRRFTVLEFTWRVSPGFPFCIHIL